MPVKQLIIKLFIGLSFLLPTKLNAMDTACLSSAGNTKLIDSKIDLSLKINTVNSLIVAKFAPKDSRGEPIAINQLALQMGYDHFNWVSYVERDPYGMNDRSGVPLFTPYNDPPLGGYQYEAADSLPFYWDLEACALCEEQHHFQNPRITRQFELIFEDYPSDHRLQPGEAVEFVTHLVGVKNYSLETSQATWNVINTFKWKLTSSTDGRGKVWLVQNNVDLSELSPSLLVAMQAEGGVLPERIHALVARLQLAKTVAIAENNEPSQTQLGCSM